MKEFVVYSAGCAWLFVVMVLVLSAHVVATPLGLALGWGMWLSSRTRSGRKFWRIWHRTNCRINNTMCPR